MLQKAKWTLLLLFLGLYAIPRILYWIKFRMDKECSETDEYKKYMGGLNFSEEYKNVKWWEM